VKKTLASSDTFHFYERNVDNTKVYLEFEELEIDLSVKRNGRSIIKMAIPIEEWRSITAGWSTSDWSKDVTRDYSPIKISKEQFDIFLSKFQNQHPEVFMDGHDLNPE
tara:strand:+ start:539 stop:862 length:324 start_codon:yes stop_codon:yes gene_type:complete